MKTKKMGRYAMLIIIILIPALAWGIETGGIWTWVAVSLYLYCLYQVFVIIKNL